MIARRVFALSMVMAATLAASPAVHASPFHKNGPLHVKSEKVKLISFSLRNDTHATVKVMAGSNEMTIEPGKTVNAKLAAGEKIVAEDGFASTTSGTVLAVIADQLKGATIVLKK